MQSLSLASKLRRATLGGTLTILTAAAALAQTAPPHYYGVTYYKTLPDKAAEYRKFLETDGAKMFQAGIDDGSVEAIYMLRLTAPYVTGSDFDYIQVVWYKGSPSLDVTPRSVWDARAKKAGVASYQAYLDKRNTLAKPVRSAWRTSYARLGDLHVGNYVRTVSAQVDSEFRQDELNFLETYTMALAKLRIAEGGEVGWSLGRPAAAIGSDDEAGFSFVISNVMKDSATLMAGPGTLTEERFKKALPGKSFAAYEAELARLNAHRKNVTTRIAEVVVLVGKLSTVNPVMP